MKHRLRIVSMILVICILICTMSSCSLISDPVGKAKRLVKRVLYGPANVTQATETTITNEIDADAPFAEAETPSAENSDQESDQDSQSPASNLKYSLTAEDIAAYYELVEECESAFLNGESTEAELTDVEDRFVAAYYQIVTQSQIAYLLYCMDTEDAKRADDYLTSSDAAADAYDAYMQLCKRMDASESPLRDRFFKGWSEVELEEMRGFSGEVTRLEKANDQILVQYRQLNEQNFYDGSADYYVQLVKNNNRIAELMGYENYWVYAYEKEYRRDYGKAEITKMREYVQTYLVPLCQRTLGEFQTRYAALSVEDRIFIAELLERADYDDF